MRKAKAAIIANNVPWIAGDVVDHVYGPARLARIRELYDLHPVRITSANLAEELPKLAEVEIIFSCWGMIPLTPAQLDLLPCLRALFYASGTTQAFARPFLDRDISISSAAEANAIPVAEFCLAQILLSCKGAHAVEREFRVISALRQAGFPVPEPLTLCEDDAVIGSSFYLMEMVEGRIFWSPTLPDLSPDVRAAHFDALNATIARLHSLDVDAIGLGDYGRPGDFFARQIARWSRQYLEDDLAGRDPNMDRLVAWLPEHAPPDDGAVSVVHGDFRADNAVFAPDREEVRAVLDWELSTLGHPMGDFTYHLMMYRLPPHMIGGFAGADLAALGIPSEADYLAAYCERVGRTPPTARDLRFYMAFNMFRLAAILHGIKGRIARGTAASAHAQTMADNLPEFAALAWAQTETTS
jgi:aminoglycoside phosphotransferase (APT) family kinase protein